MPTKKKPTKKKPSFEKKYVVLDKAFETYDGNTYDTEEQARQRAREGVEEAMDNPCSNPVNRVQYVAVVIGGVRDPNIHPKKVKVEEF